MLITSPVGYATDNVEMEFATTVEGRHCEHHTVWSANKSDTRVYQATRSLSTVMSARHVTPLGHCRSGVEEMPSIKQKCLAGSLNSTCTQQARAATKYLRRHVGGQVMGLATV